MKWGQQRGSISISEKPLRGNWKTYGISEDDSLRSRKGRKWVSKLICLLRGRHNPDHHPRNPRAYMCVICGKVGDNLMEMYGEDRGEGYVDVRHFYDG